MVNPLSAFPQQQPLTRKIYEVSFHCVFFFHFLFFFLLLSLCEIPVVADPSLSESLNKPTPLFFSVWPQLLAVFSEVPLRHLAVCCYRSWSVSSSWYLVLLLSLSRMWCVVRQYHFKHGTPGFVTPSMDQPKLQCLIHSWVQTLAWIHCSQCPRSTSSLSIKILNIPKTSCILPYSTLKGILASCSWAH